MMETQSIVESYLPLGAVLASLLAVPLILLSTRHPNLRESWSVLASLVKFGIVLVLAGMVREGEIAACTLFEIAPGVGLSFRADSFGVFFALISSGLWILTSLYSIGYMRGHHERHQTRYYASFALSLSATIGVAFSANLLTFILFYELLTLATYPLVIHSETREAIRAGRQYLAFSLTAGLLLIAGAAGVYQLTGTMDFQPGGVLTPDSADGATLKGLFGLFLVGVGVKAGVMPLHSWLPNAMVAPTPVSALLHAVAVVKSGVFGVVRVVGFVFGPETMSEHGLHALLAVFAGATILLASLIALKQNNLKRRLAYSTVGHLSYIILGVALLSLDGFAGGVFHISTHALMKITLFFCAGAIIVHLHKEEISELDGIGRAMPWTMAAFAIGSFGLAGVPPINGFVSKWFLCGGSVEAGSYLALGVFLVSGLLNAGYFLPIVHRAFFREPRDRLPDRDASPWMVVPLCVAAVLSVIFGLAPNLGIGLFDLAREVSRSVLGG